MEPNQNRFTYLYQWMLLQQKPNSNLIINQAEGQAYVNTFYKDKEVKVLNYQKDLNGMTCMHTRRRFMHLFDDDYFFSVN